MQCNRTKFASCSTLRKTKYSKFYSKWEEGRKRGEGGGGNSEKWEALSYKPGLKCFAICLKDSKVSSRRWIFQCWDDSIQEDLPTSTLLAETETMEEEKKALQDLETKLLN